MGNTATRPLAIVGGTLIDGTGAAPTENGVVLIENGRITAIDPRGELPPHVQKIPAAGKYVMPGMMDANVHLFFTITPDLLIRYEDSYEKVIAESAQVALKAGLTTVFDTWGPREALTRVRDRINREEVLGSRIFCAGNIIGLGGPTSEDFFPIARAVLGRSEAERIDRRWEQGVGPELLWMSAEEVQARVRAYIETGRVDFLKYASSGHTHMQFICFSAEVQKRIVAEGHRAQMTVQAHTTSPESLRMEIEAGCDLLQHPDITGAAEMPEETLMLIAERRIPCAAMFVSERFLSWNAAHGREPMKQFREVQARNDRRLVGAGAQILLTTDAGVLPPDVADHPLLGSGSTAADVPTEMGEAHFRWLEAAAGLGMRPMDALLAATRNIARAYKVDQDLGTLETGKIADLLILGRNPLEAPVNYRSIEQVVQQGRLIDRQCLPETRCVRGPIHG